MALTLSGTNGVVGAGFTLDPSGASVTSGVGTFGSVVSSGQVSGTIGAFSGTSTFANSINLTHASAGSNIIYFNEDITLAKNGTGSRFAIDTSGNATVNSGNLVIGTAGKGIDFSATGDGSGTDTSELFDDYEEGTFNLTLPENGSGNQTVTNNPAGRYTKIGGFVYIYVYAIFSGSPQNNASGWQLGGLPYAPGTSGFTHHGMGQIQYTETYNYSVWRPLIASNSRIYFHRTDGSNNSLLNQDVVSIGMSYFLMGASYMSVN